MFLELPSEPLLFFDGSAELGEGHPGYGWALPNDGVTMVGAPLTMNIQTLPTFEGTVLVLQGMEWGRIAGLRWSSEFHG